MYLPSTKTLIGNELLLIIAIIYIALIDSLKNNFWNYFIMSVAEIQYFHYDKWCQIIQSTTCVPVKFELRTIFCLQEHQQSSLTDNCVAMNLEEYETNPCRSANCQNLVSTQTVLNTTSFENMYQLDAKCYVT